MLKNVIKLVKILILASFLVVETKYFDKGNLGEKEFIQATVPGYSWNTVPWWGSHHGGAHNRWSHSPQYRNKIKAGSSAHWLSSLSLFHSVQIPVCDTVSHIEDRPSNLSYLNLKKKKSLSGIPMGQPNLAKPSLRFPFWEIPVPAKFAIKMNPYNLQADLNHQIVTCYDITSFPSRSNKVLNESNLTRGGLAWLTVWGHSPSQQGAMAAGAGVAIYRESQSGSRSYGHRCSA